MAVVSLSQMNSVGIATQIINFEPDTKESEIKEIKLKKDGTPKKICSNKKKGKKSEVYHIQIEDMKKITTYFVDNEKWLCYLIFVLSCNMARRIGDTLSLTWNNFFDPVSGQLRADLLEIKEEKTDKLANPRINSACRSAIQLYIEKTGCDPSIDNYSVPICMQLDGNYAGHIMSYSCYRKNLKKAALESGIEYNVAAHSPRKTFGMMNRMIHPGDYDSMEILQTIFNHSDVKTTNRYIGLTKQKVDQYYDDMGTFFDEYITGDKEYQDLSGAPIISLDANDLRDIIKSAYESGKTNANNPDAMVHVDAITQLIAMVDQLKR